MSFGFLVAAFLGVTNAGRVGVARLDAGGSPVLPLVAGFVLVAAAALLAEELLDLLAISPESLRIAAGLVLAVTGLWALVGPVAHSGPVVSALITPELAVLAVSAGADERPVEVLGAAALALALVALACVAPRRELLVPAARLLAALQVIVAVALVVSGVRDV
jgi:small neutral amino acid transporter SnatA (MarC family)